MVTSYWTIPPMARAVYGCCIPFNAAELRSATWREWKETGIFFSSYMKSEAFYDSVFLVYVFRDPSCTRHTSSNLLLTNRNMDHSKLWSCTCKVLFLSFLIALHKVNQLQTFASVGLSVFYHFCSCHMVDYRYSLMWVLLRLAPIISKCFNFL